MDSYRNLRVWQEAVELAVAIYALTEHFPRQEQFGLTNQLRRAVVSISSNIAEGKGRGTRKDYCHFLYMARGSLLEVQSQMEIAVRLNFVGASDAETVSAKTDSLGRGLNALIRSFRNKPSFETAEFIEQS